MIYQGVKFYKTVIDPSLSKMKFNPMENENENESDEKMELELIKGDIGKETTIKKMKNFVYLK
jgi:hypothetical protein